MLCAATAALLLCNAAFGADDSKKIAKINSYELHERAISILLGKPENIVKKTEYNRLVDEVAAAQLQLETAKDDESRRQIQQKISDAMQREQSFKKSLDPEARRFILNAIREVSKGRFLAVLDENANENLVYKDGDLVDITYDVKEELLSGPAEKARTLDAAPPRIVLSPPTSSQSPQ